MAGLNFRALALRAALALPGPVLRAVSGGAAVHVGGRTLDPRLQVLAAHRQHVAPLSSQTPDAARVRARAALGLLRGPAQSGVTVQSRRVPGGAGDLAARLYRPRTLTPDATLLVFAHGGGGVTGDLDACEDFCALFAAEAGWPVLSIDYRLAPEHRFPAGLEDLIAASLWARNSVDEFGVAPGQIAVGGESFGANLAAAACQALARRGEAQPRLQLLICPLLDAAGDQPSMSLYGGAWPLTAADVGWFMGHYIGPGDSPEDPAISPLRAADLSGLAPAVIACAGFDPLLDQSEIYARRLAAAGAPVAYRCFDSLAHGFTMFLDIVPAARMACRQIAALARDFGTGRET
jgi:acetyl esterase/lipase